MKNIRKICLFVLLLIFSISAFGNTYKGLSKGYQNDIEVEVVLNENGKINDVKILKNQDTKGIGDIAGKKIPQLIVKKQSLDIDSVAGATITSEAIVTATANAIKAAGLDVKKYGFKEKIIKEKDETVKINPDKMPKKKPIEKVITVKDVKGREVNLNLPISSFAVSTMDIMDFIIPLKGKEAFNMLVGSGEDGGHGLNKYAKLYSPVVGKYMEHTAQISDHNAPFDLEMILSMQPDVLIVNSAMAAHKYALEIEDQLTQAGIKIILIDVPGKKIENSVQQTMKLLGQIFSEEARAKEVIDFIDTQYNLVLSKDLRNEANKPTVYYEKSGYSQIFGSTSTSNVGWGTIIDLAGGKNIADDLLMEKAAGKGSGNKLDPEYVLESNPDFIFVSGINKMWLSSVSKNNTCSFDIVNRNGWNNLKAIKNKNLYEFAHSTNRSIYGFYPTLKMATILYPEKFKGVNPEKILDEFFEKFMLLDSNISTWLYNIKDEKNK
ncbi:ABC transporter substrate-binding protein [Fusobacterium russii]|uniref:ABC transporter substrate-binding protein n=1 Tax=Fusobacterium russii TaxID=854 RepID=UPI0003A79241|nr:ABC transporter substrate-binding protein [Fusobacterium russii]